MPIEDKTKTKKDDRVLLGICPDSIVDVFGNDKVCHERGEHKWYTKAEAAQLLAAEYGGRKVFVRVVV